jgi:group I intron endonuclease
MAITGIYKITSPTGKVYIGQSWDVRSRWAQHKRRDSKGMVISKSIAKHGADSHLFSLVHELPKDVTQDVMDIYEQLYMDAYRCCGVQLLNSREGGSAGRLSPETIKKMSESRKGRRMSESAKIKLRAHRIGKPLSEEHKEKLRISSIGKNKGLVRSAETRLKYSEAKKGQVLSEETKDKLRKTRIKKRRRSDDQ